jgi:exonuclease III
LKILTWNIEGWKRNYLNLKHFTDEIKPDLILLSEPQSFQCDIPTYFECFQGKYSYSLNSNDLFSPDLPLDTRKGTGGTMILWRTKLGPYIKVLPSTSPSVLPILLSIPGVAVSAHIALYLPTSGKEAEFATALAALEASIEQIKEDHSCPIYLRGDCNVNVNNHQRATIFKHFCSRLDISNIDLDHPTYHHFLGDGKSDSQLDLILSTGSQAHQETIKGIN